VELPATNITVVIRNDNVGLTAVWLNALNSSVNDWNLGTRNWAASVYSTPGYIAVTGDNGMTAVIQNIENTIGYVALCN
jgi:ABC-type phosphate transport system substrate-binding protein